MRNEIIRPIGGGAARAFHFDQYADVDKIVKIAFAEQKAPSKAEGQKLRGSDKIKLVGADAPPSAYDMIRKGGFEVASAPEPSSLFGYEAVDAVVRAMAGQEPTHFLQPVFLIVKDNVETEGGKNNEFAPSNNFACHYENIWKGKSKGCN